MRSHDYERQFLEYVAHAAKQSGEAAQRFSDDVMVRLEKGGAEYGDDNFWERGLDWVLANAAEEGEDIAGWIVGAAQVLNDLEEIPGDAAHEIHCLLMEAAADGMRAWTRIHIARSIAGEHIASDEPTHPISGG